MSEPKEIFQIKIMWLNEYRDFVEPDTYTFTTQQELEGFKLGISVACGWYEYNIVREDQLEREVFIKGLATKLTFRVEWEDVDHRVPWESVSKPFIIPLTKREAINDVDFGPVMDASDLDVDSIDGLDKLLKEIENEEDI